MLIWPYVLNADIYKCPARTDDALGFSPIPLCGYACNAVVWNYRKHEPPIGGQRNPGVGLTKIPDRARVALLYDVSDRRADKNTPTAWQQPFYYAEDHWDHAWQCHCGGYGPHRGGYNIAWCDGHADWHRCVSSGDLGLTPRDRHSQDLEGSYPYF